MDIQDAGIDTDAHQDVFHTPPEEHTSLPSSQEQRPPVASDAGFCHLNEAVTVVDSEPQDSVDLGVCSDVADLGEDMCLGFSEGEDVDAEMVADIEGDGVPGDGDSDSHRVVPIGRKLPPSLGARPGEKAKASEPEEAVDKRDFVFKVLKFLAENTPKGNDDEDHSLWDTLKRCGVDFPHPR